MTDRQINALIEMAIDAFMAAPGGAINDPLTYISAKHPELPPAYWAYTLNVMAAVGLIDPVTLQ